MGTWVEFRCERRGQSAGIYASCLSNKNSGPMLMCADDRASILSGLQLMREDALSTGWVRNRDGWVCPNCISAEKQTETTT